MIGVKAYRLSRQAVELRAAAETPPPVTRGADLDGELGLGEVGRQGWVLLCPQAFTASWNGGERAEDVEIAWEGATAGDRPPETAFVRSILGSGRLTFYPGYQFKTEGGHVLWLRGPVNAPKDGLAPIESVVDASLLPCTVSVDWQFTRPHQTVRFAAQEPFATLLLVPRAGLESVTVEVVERESDTEAHERAFQAMVDGPALNDVFLRLGATPDESDPQGATFAFADAGARASAPAPASWAARLTDPPPVSCICPTYGRVALLEEAIQSFLQQDYPGPKELIVLNDYDGQTLAFDHPEVRIVNRAERFPSLGEKFNAAVALASHDLLFVWHDDDISLPHRLSFSVAQCGEGRVFFKAENAWFWNDGRLSGPEKNVFHGGSCWRRALFDKVHGYPSVEQRYDVEFEQRCQGAALGPLKVATLMLDEVYYLYRWNGTGSYHASVMGGDVSARKPQTVPGHVAEQAARGQIPQGRVQLEPRWRTDYAALVRGHLTALPAAALDAHAKATRAVDDLPFPPPFHVIAPPPALEGAEAAELFRGDYPLRISVILPSANESVLLERTVDQFAATLPPDSEVIVVDNGSSDGCADFLANAPRDGVHLIRTPELLGVSGARNRGLAQARGEIVVFADAHIDVPERWWQPMAALLKRPEVGVVGPGIGVMGLPQAPIACGQRVAESKLRLQWLPWKGMDPFPVPTLGGGMMAMRHATLEQAGAFDAGMPQWGSEDLELCVRYWLLGYEVWVAPAVTVLHYFRKTNPYRVEWGAVTHNLLRVALLHFNQSRLTRVVNALKGSVNFAAALAHAVESDVWQRRAEFAARRIRDDDWLFEKFADCCEV